MVAPGGYACRLRSRRCGMVLEQGGCHVRVQSDRAVSPDHATPASIRTPAGVRHPQRTLREALRLLWSIAEGLTQRRLLVALALVASGAVLAAVTQIALLESLAQGAAEAGGVVAATPPLFVGSHALGQYLSRVLAVARSFMHSQEDAGARHRASHRGELIFDRVTFSYREERAVLQDVSFIVPAGKTVAIVGISGSGKSSLIRLLFRLYEPDAGRIVLDGTPIGDLSLSALRQAIAVVPPDTVLFHDTIASNIGFGRAGASLLDIQEAARIANLHQFIVGLRDGYETMVGERGLKLSGGERQRIAIARAALKKPRIFVFDEATSALDAKTEREILRNVLAVSARSTTLVIAHRLGTIRHADHIVVLDRGVVLEQGTHEQLRARNGAYAALWRAEPGEVPGAQSTAAARRGVAKLGNAPNLSP